MILDVSCQFPNTFPRKNLMYSVRFLLGFLQYIIAARFLPNVLFSNFLIFCSKFPKFV